MCEIGKVRNIDRGSWFGLTLSCSVVGKDTYLPTYLPIYLDSSIGLVEQRAVKQPVERMHSFFLSFFIQL